jgi:hypothetical protein
MIWTDSQLQQWSLDAEQQIQKDVQCIFKKFYLQINQGQSLYTLPAFVRSILRITYRGRKLDAVSWDEMLMLTPATVVVGIGNTANIESSQSRPYYYAMHPTNVYDVRFFPTPPESLTAGGPDPYSPTVYEPYCNISCFRNIDSTYNDSTAILPTYIDRRTRKAYVLWKAFASEGKGQNLKAAAYYQAKYEFLVERFKMINEGCFIGKKYMVDDGALSIDGFKYPKPILPANFERVIFR